MITTDPRIIDKPIIDASGNWTTAPHIVWRDATGMHDRPALTPLHEPVCPKGLSQVASAQHQGELECAFSQ